ncbi:MAG: hypothetical protein DRP10_02920 [Candidatus Aenigmatarchaeota archaeon]|nr:MAG: hypothetical protein DRP10_02920 [Candidatus Aenigmarchaeota archaeon]
MDSKKLAKVRELLKRNIPKSEISRELKISRPTINKIAKEFNKEIKEKKLDIELEKQIFKEFSIGKEPADLLLKYPKTKVLSCWEIWLEVVEGKIRRDIEFLKSLENEKKEKLKEIIDKVSSVVSKKVLGFDF